MRVAVKIVIALLLVIGSVIGAFTLIRFRREDALFESDMRADHEAIAALAGKALRRVAKQRGEQEALAMLASLEPPHVTLAAVPEPFSAPATYSESHGDELVTRARLLDDSVWGTLELRESFDERDRYIVTTRRNVVLSALGLTVGSFAVVSVLGWLLIGKPVRALVQQARRIGGGNFAPTPVRASRDELDILAAELNKTALALSEARDRIESETVAKLSALARLRHADRLATVGTLAAGVAHELGSPLNVVLARAKMLTAADASPEALRSAQVIRDQTERMATIVRQLLNFARRSPPAWVPTKLDERVRSLGEFLAHRLEDAEVRLDISGLERVEAEVDPNLFDQMLTNVLLNSLQATPSGGEVRVSLRAVGPYAEITIEDTGTGMDSEAREHAFEPFFTTKQVGEGTGLGLSVVHGLVEDHRGEIAIERSAPGEGTRIAIRLPLQARMTSPPPRAVELTS
jgi:two-component system NtrC family sensor kinase